MICKNSKPNIYKRLTDKNAKFEEGSPNSVDIKPTKLTKNEIYDDSNPEQLNFSINSKGMKENIHTNFKIFNIADEESIDEDSKNRIVNLEHFNPSHQYQTDIRKSKSKSKSKKKIPKPVKRNLSKQNINQSKDEESMRAFEDYLLGKKNEGGRKSTNSSFVNRAYDNKVEQKETQEYSIVEGTHAKSALSQMSKDYEYLKEKVIKLQNKLDESEFKLY